MVIVLAAGRGERMDVAMPKALVKVAGRAIVERAVERATGCPSVTAAVVVAPPGLEDEVARIVEPHPVIAVVTGGPSRQASARAGLEAVPAEASVIVCHDAARVLASADLFERVVGALDGWDGVVPLLPVTDTVKRVEGDRVTATEPRDALAIAQTPQAFVASALREAHAAAVRDDAQGTDDASLLERVGFRVRGIRGDRLNLKITTAEDLWLAEALEGVR